MGPYKTSFLYNRVIFHFHGRNGKCWHGTDSTFHRAHQQTLAKLWYHFANIAFPRKKYKTWYQTNLEHYFGVSSLDKSHISEAKLTTSVLKIWIHHRSGLTVLKASLKELPQRSRRQLLMARGAGALNPFNLMVTIRDLLSMLLGGQVPIKTKPCWKNGSVCWQGNCLTKNLGKLLYFAGGILSVARRNPYINE